MPPSPLPQPTCPLSPPSARPPPPPLPPRRPSSLLHPALAFSDPPSLLPFHLAPSLFLASGPASLPSSLHPAFPDDLASLRDGSFIRRLLRKSHLASFLFRWCWCCFRCFCGRPPPHPPLSPNPPLCCLFAPFCCVVTVLDRHCLSPLPPALVAPPHLPPLPFVPPPFSSSSSSYSVHV